MSESYDYQEQHWDSGHTFGQARQDYQKRAQGSYEDATRKGTTNEDLLPEFVETQAQHPLFLAIDMTGSMREGYPTFKDKSPYLQFEVKDGYLGTDNEICMMAFGDAVMGEDYALQARPFTTGKNLKGAIDEIVHTKKGGGNESESSELVGLYLLHNARLRQGAKPVLIIFTDEHPQESVTPAIAKKYARLTLKRTWTTEEIFQELQRTYTIYVIQRHDTNYGGNMTQRVYNRWCGLVGKDHVVQLPAASIRVEGRDRLPEEHVVDMIFGILAVVTNKITYFRAELTARQKPWQVERVLACLDPILPKQEPVEPKQELEDVGPLL